MIFALITTIFDITWLSAVLALLFLIWRSSERRLKQGAVMEAALVEVARKDAESARLAVMALRELMDGLKLKEATQHDA